MGILFLPPHSRKNYRPQESSTINGTQDKNAPIMGKNTHFYSALPKRCRETASSVRVDTVLPDIGCALLRAEFLPKQSTHQAALL